MKSDFNRQVEKDTKVIAESIRQQLPVIVTTYTLPRNMETYIREVLSVFLKECRQEHMYEYLNFCLGELLTNAKKANTKRIYFKDKNLDINNPEDYKKGMESFKEDTLTNIDYYLELQKKAGLYIKMILQLKGDKVKIEIRNNSVLNPVEEERIKNKLESVQQYTSMEDAFHNVLDQSEGAGLGIIIMVLMLQKVGLSKDNYQVFVDGDETVTRIVLPCNEKIFGGTDLLSYQFVRLQDSIPCLKDTFAKAQKCAGNTKKYTRSDLYEQVSKDTMLTMLLLKRAFQKNIRELDLVKIFEQMSDEELEEIYSLDNPDVSIVRSSKTAKPIFNHAQNVASFAYNIAKNHDIAKIFTPEEMYTIGLLNSFGNIILKTASDEQKDYVEQILGSFDLADKIRDLFYCGIEAGYLGMVYAKKEGFPEGVSSILGHWNNFDENSTEDCVNAQKIIYLAESLQSYDEGNLQFYQLDKAILSVFNISSEKQFTYLLKLLKKND